MKQTILLCIVALLSTFALFSPAASGSLNSCPDGIFSYWHLDEDMSGSYVDAVCGFEGTCTDSTCPARTSVDDGAVRGKAAQTFDGVDDIISIAPDELFNWTGSDKFSIELWMKWTPDSSSHVLIARKDSSNSMEWKLYLQGDGTPIFSLYDQNGNGNNVVGNKKVDNDAWHHIAVTRDGSDTTLYVDGEVQSSVSPSYSGGFASDTAPITIGGINDSNPQLFNGMLDEVAIYNSALDISDIKAHYYLSRDYCGLYDNVVRIMPLGDSITDDNQNGQGEPYPTTGNGYRKPLWDTLVGNLFWVDFIGYRNNESGDFDMDHSGFPGITASQMNGLLETGTNPRNNNDITNPYPYLDDLHGYPSDVILLHIGTNGLREDTIDTIAAGVEDILDQIDKADFRTTVLVARIIDRLPLEQNSFTHRFNDSVVGMINSRNDAGDKIIIADMEEGANLTYALIENGGDFHDSLHPHDSGYAKMAAQWYTPLNTILPKVTQTPTIQSSPITTADKGRVYSYDVIASGTPPPSFSLSNAPGGMTINEDTGLIQWTPDALGQVNVVVEAANTGADWGKDNQAFIIDVNGVPDAVADSYTAGETQTLSIPAAEGVLANDTDEDDDSLTAQLVSSTQHGSLSFNSDGSFTYAHDGSGALSDSFTYKALDGKTDSEAGTVTISITPANDPPVITSQPVAKGIINEPYVYLPEATDKENDPLSWSLSKSPSGMTINTDTGEINWTPDSTGTYDVTVRVTDGKDGVNDQSYQITVTQTGSSDDGDGGSGGGGGGGCFIQSLF